MGKKLREIGKFSLGRGGRGALKLFVIPVVLIMLLIFAVLKKGCKSSESMKELSRGDPEEDNDTLDSHDDNERIIKRDRDKNPQQCRGVTASGRRCRRMVYNGDGFCAQHSDQAKT